MSGDENYEVAEKVDLKTIAEMDPEDDSLARYKQALLGDVSNAFCPEDDPRRVVIEKMIVMFDNRPDGDIEYELDSQQKLAAMKSNPFTLKEKCHYKIKVQFRVQHEIVSGLKYINNVYRKGVRVVKEDEMIGSFGPQSDPHVVVFPRHGWDEAPSGMLARGTYTATSRFLDDDKQKHLEYEYSFKIGKNW